MIKEFKEYEDIIFELTASEDSELEKKLNFVEERAFKKALTVAKIIDNKYLDKQMEIIEEKINELKKEKDKLQRIKEFFIRELHRFIKIFSGDYIEVDMNGVRKYIVPSYSVKHKVKEDYIDILKNEKEIGTYEVKLTADEYKKVVEILPNITDKAKYSVRVTDLINMKREEAYEEIKEPTIKIVKTKPKTIDNEDISL